MNTVGVMRLTFAICQFALLVFGADLRLDTNCSECQNSSVDTVITAEDIKREILKLEKEKILQQLQNAEEEFRRSQEILSDEAAEYRRYKRAVRRGVQDVGGPDLNESMSHEDSDEQETALIVGQLVRRGSTTTIQCYDEAGRMGSCIDFQNKSDIQWDRFKFAKLWIKLHPDVAKANAWKNHTFSVKAINFGRPDNAWGHYPTNITIGTGDAKKYLGIDVTNQILRRALIYSQQADQDDKDPIQCVMTLRVTCLTCGNTARSPIAMTPDLMPFLEIGFNSRRKRTSPVCELEGDYLVKNSARRGCCLVPVDVNFADIGMEYILHPLRYRTHYCSGRCHHYTTRSYSAVIQRVLNTKLQKMQQDDQISLCCIPLYSKNLPIVFQNQSGAVSPSNLKDMIVTSCGC